MQIESIQLYRVPLALAPAAVEAGGRLESIVVGMTAGGHTGWGEAVLGAAPTERAEWSAGAFLCLQQWLAPALVGREINTGAQLQEALGAFQGNPFAKAALDIAWWNLAAVGEGRPLYRQLGGSPAAVPLSTTLGVTETSEELFDGVRRARELGYQAVSLKFRPGWGVEMLRAVRQRFPADPIAIDCDALCTIEQQEMFYRVEDFHLLYIEQPLAADDLVGHAMLQQSIRTPICLDQSVTSEDRVEQILDLGSCQRARIDPFRLGGLTPALAVRARFEVAQVPCGLNASQPSGLAMFATLALATLPNFALPAETNGPFEMPKWVANKSLTQMHKNDDWRLNFVPSEEPGAGITVDGARLAAAASEQATVRAATR